MKKLPRFEDMVGNVEPEEFATLPAAGTAETDDRSRSAVFNASSCRCISDWPGVPPALHGCSSPERADNGRDENVSSIPGNVTSYIPLLLSIFASVVD